LNKFDSRTFNLEKLYYFDYLHSEFSGEVNKKLLKNEEQKIDKKDYKSINKDINEEKEIIRKVAEDAEKPSNENESVNNKNSNVFTEEVVLEEKITDGKNITLFTNVKPGNRSRISPKPSSSTGDFDNKLSLRDVNSLWAFELVKYDKRSISHIYLDYLSERTLLSLILKKSVIEPLWLRFSYSLLFLSILFTINAMMYSDEYIDARLTLPQKVRVNIY
jgi:uncharacterized protein (DUF2344 family)